MTDSAATHTLKLNRVLLPTVDAIYLSNTPFWFKCQTKLNNFSCKKVINLVRNHAYVV